VHEWALAQAVVAEVEKIVKRGGRVERIVVYLGELQAVDREVFNQYISMMIEEVSPSTSIEYVEEKARFSCRVCNSEWSLDMVELDEATREAIHFLPEAVYSYIRCPRCGSRDYEIVAGRGVRVGIDYR